MQNQNKHIAATRTHTHTLAAELSNACGRSRSSCQFGAVVPFHNPAEAGELFSCCLATNASVEFSTSLVPGLVGFRLRTLCRVCVCCAVCVDVILAEPSIVLHC